MTSNIAAIYTPLQNTQTVRIVTGSNGGNIAIYDFDNEGMFTAAAVCATGNVYAGNVAASGNVSGAYILGNGSQLTNIASGEPNFDIKSSDFSAVVGARYGVDTTSNTVTASLPASPATGGAVFFADAGGAYATNNLIIDPNGLTIMGDSGNMTVSTNNQSVGLFYNGTTWRIYNAG
jgi:hypothetical protein